MSKPAVLITGSGRRLGRKILYAFHRHGGFDLVQHYNASDDEAEEARERIQSEGGSVLGIKADLRNPVEIAALFKKIGSDIGRLDVLINNAAIFNRFRWDDTDVDAWDDLHRINLRAVYLCSQAGAHLMMKNPGKGRIINVASLGGIQAWKNHIHYSAAKAGVINLTKSLAKALAPSITVNAIAPGTIIVPGEEDPDVRHIDEDRILLKRYGQPSDIEEVMLFLATQASYITGIVIPVDGGQSVGSIDI